MRRRGGVGAQLGWAFEAWLERIEPIAEGLAVSAARETAQASRREVAHVDPASHAR